MTILTLPRRRQARPMAPLVRVDNYVSQNELNGRYGDITVRQERQIRRMARRSTGKATS